jgi:transcription antitermination factor NusG
MKPSESIPGRYPSDRSLEDDLGSWWVIHVKPNREWKVAKYFLHHEITYYLPLYDRKTKVGYLKREKIVKAPLFRGYLCFALEKGQHGLLHECHDYVRIIDIPDQYKFVQEMEHVSKALDTCQDLFVKPGIVKGRKVLIASGPMEGVVGIVSGRSKKGQVALTVEMFNRTVIVNTDQFTNLEILE